jgi:hypothetical protein
LKTTNSFFLLSERTLLHGHRQSEQLEQDRHGQLHFELYSYGHSPVPNGRKYTSNQRDHLVIRTPHFQDDKKLEELQIQEWDPVIEWFNKRYDTELTKTTTFDAPQVGDKTRMHVSRYLMSYNDEAIHGFVYAIDTLKSVVLAFASIDRFLSIEKSVLLARLEEEFQLGHWGRVEWCHDLCHVDLQARLAAAVLFIHCNSENSLVKEKIL